MYQKGDDLIYGMILLGNVVASSQEQCDGILQYAKKHDFRIDKILSHSRVPVAVPFKPGDSVVFFSWNCISEDRANLNAFIQYALKNDINIYSATSSYKIDKSKDYEQLLYAFKLYEEIRTCFISAKGKIGVKTKIANGLKVGRVQGSRNTKHSWDGKEKKILSLYAQGLSMNVIAKKVKLSPPTIKRFLTIRG